jgi:itaconyl-CoA hydratase
MAVKEGWTGRVFEDFEVGDIYRHPLGRTILAADNTWFTLLTQNTNPIHFDHHYAAQTEFKRPLVNSALTLAVVMGQSVGDLSQNALANLGWDDVRLPGPVFEGDTVYSSSEVLETRESRSRPNVGIVRVKTTGVNHEGRVVIEFRRAFMVYKRGQVPDRDPKLA